MKKIVILFSLVLMTITIVGCTNNSTNTPQNEPISQPTEIKLTTSNISSYLGIDVTNDSNVYIDDYHYDSYGSSGWLAGSFEVSSFPKKTGHFENVTIGFEYSADTWSTSSNNKLSLTIPLDGKITKNFDIYKLTGSGSLYPANPKPSIRVKITSVSGIFIEE